VPDYRIFKVNQSGRVVASSEIVTCDTDEEVFAKAESMLDGLDLEIWEGARRVAILPSKD
jgi:hypothetical protein